MSSRRRITLGLLALPQALLAFTQAGVVHASESASNPAPKPSPEAHEKTLLFGDLHVHSGWSLDTLSSGVRATPLDAYRYAQGKPIDHVSGSQIQLAGPPLDFMALTEHAEYLGVFQAAQQKHRPFAQLPLIKSLMGKDKSLRQRAWQKIQTTYQNRQALPALTQDAVITPAWRTLGKLANEQNRPGVFSALLGFEYTSNPDGQNLHRNVLFRSADAPARPFSSMDSINPEDLWRWMDAQRAEGFENLAIPHNANGSNGLMFALTRFDGTPIDRAWAELRARNEPAAEIMQIKGQSETHPALSPEDEWARFEIVEVKTLRPQELSAPKGSYVRDALREGLALEEEIGVNPYMLGAIASTDGHNAASPFEEANYSGKLGRTDATPEQRLAPGPGPPSSVEGWTAPLTMRWGAAGLAGVWAAANTREAIFDAVKRRETFGTSGPRIRVRLAAGWDLGKTTAESAVGDVLASGAIAMGGVLPPPTSPPAGPRFLIAAQRDPLGANLERLQIVKGSTEAGATRERVIDVACADGARPGAESGRCPESTRAPTPDLATCTPRDEAGRPELRALWQDPDFDPDERAFYYVRVIEIPTCRWTTFDANRLGRAPPEGVPPTLQERAITSPVWTSAPAAAAAKPAEGR